MIQYNKHVATDSGTYSIDYFTFDFLLLTTVRIFDLLELKIEKRKSSCIKYQHFQTNKFGYPKSVFQCDSLHIELIQNNKMLRMSFNPNHCIDSAVLAFLLRFVRTNCGVIAFRCARCDYTYDIPVSPDSVMILSRKTEGHFKTTRYYGARGSSGYLRVYDKRVEEKSRLKDDFIGYDLTRLEWEQRNDAEFRFDRFSVPDFSDLRGYAALLKYVDPAFYNAALKELDKRTRSALVKKVFQEYPFTPEVFQHLRELYFREYGLLDTFQSEWPKQDALQLDIDEEELP